MVEIGDSSTRLRTLAFTLAGIQYYLSGDDNNALPLLEIAYDSKTDPGGHPFVTKFMNPDFRIEVSIAPTVSAEIPFGRQAVGLILAEVFQSLGDYEGAITAVNKLAPSLEATVSLAELCTLSGYYEDVLDLTEALPGSSVESYLLATYRALALVASGREQEGIDEYSTALAQAGLPEILQILCLVGRAEAYLHSGDLDRSREDLKRLRDLDPTNPELEALRQDLRAREEMRSSSDLNASSELQVKRHKTRGLEIYNRFKDGSSTDIVMGRGGGLPGKALQDDIASGGWRAKLYEVSDDPVPPNQNWFAIRDFVEMVEAGEAS